MRSPVTAPSVPVPSRGRGRVVRVPIVRRRVGHFRGRDGEAPDQLEDGYGGFRIEHLVFDQACVTERDGRPFELGIPAHRVARDANVRAEFEALEEALGVVAVDDAAGRGAVPRGIGPL
jgi:hypothetical protein